MWTHKPQLQLLIIRTQRTEVYLPARYIPSWQTKKTIMIFTISFFWIDLLGLEPRQIPKPQKYCTSLHKRHKIRVGIHGCETLRVHCFMIIWLYMYHQQNDIYQNQILQINIIKNTCCLWRYSNCLLVPLTVVPFIRARLSCFLHVKGQRQSFWGFLCSQFKWRRQKKIHERLVALVSYQYLAV